MSTNLFVAVSGPALSLLMYENVIGTGDQRGFLLGAVNHHVINTISDSEIQDKKTETSICVTSLIPIPNSLSLYSGSGKVNEAKLKAFLKDKQGEVVGWYSFKRSTGLIPLLRDKLLHKAFCKIMDHMSPDLMAMCLLNTTVNNTGSTHIFNHKFMRYNNNQFEVLPMRVHNLGETQNSEYRTTPSVVTLTENFKQIVNTNLQLKEGKTDDQLVSRIQLYMQNYLRSLIDEVAVSEMEIAELEAKVESLRSHSGPISNEILLPQLLQEQATVSSLSSSRIGAVNNRSEDSSDLVGSSSESNSINKKDLNNVALTGEFVPKNTLTSADPFEKSLSPEIKTAMAAQLRSGKQGYPNLQQSSTVQRRRTQNSEQDTTQKSASTPATPKIDYSQAVKKASNTLPGDQHGNTSKRVTRARMSNANGSEN